MRHDKLVRDRIPAIIASQGRVPVTRVLGEAEYRAALCAKLQEEAAECAQAPCAEELADVLEVVEAMRAMLGIPPEELARVKAEKAAQRGGFAQRIYLEEVDE